MTDRGSLTTQLSALAQEHGTVPAEVVECVTRTRQLGIWCEFSRNASAQSCADAARKRNRLGHCGIPLWDELKSILGRFLDSTGQERSFLAHCRGDRELDNAKLSAALDSAVGAETTTVQGWQAADYGTINPFTTRVGSGLQIFDYELQRPLGVPGTVVTNAGERTWAVEFDPAELVVKMPGARWADISRAMDAAPSSLLWGVREPLAIGILTGNPADSGIDLWARINSHVRHLLGPNSLGDVSMPRVVVVSSPQVGISMEMDRREEPLKRALLRSVEELCAAGARLIVHPAHTTSYFIPAMESLAAEKGAKFLSMPDLTADMLQQSGVRELFLLGTRFVTDLTSTWSVYRRALAGMTVHTPTEDGWSRIHDLAYLVQQRGPVPLAFNLMRDLLRREVPPDCIDVFLALTELSPLVKHLKPRGRSRKRLIDPVELYAQAIAEAYLGLSRESGTSRSFLSGSPVPNV